MADEMACPCCGSRMQPRMEGATELDHCEFCGGLWFDAGELEGVLGTAVASPTSVKQHRKCPRCQLAMDRVLVGRTTVERCGACRGFFLDGGELEELRQRLARLSGAPAAAPAAGARPPAPAPEPAQDDGEPRVEMFDCRKCGGRFPYSQGYAEPTGRICDKCAGFATAEKSEPSALEWFLMGFVRNLPTKASWYFRR